MGIDTRAATCVCMCRKDLGLCVCIYPDDYGLFGRGDYGEGARAIANMNWAPL